MAGDGRFPAGRNRNRFGSRDRPGACRFIAPVPWCYRRCSLSGGNCRPVGKIPCVHSHGNSRRHRPHFAPSVPSAGRMSPSSVNRGAGNGFQPNLGTRKADLHVSVRDTRSGKRQVWDIDRSPTPPCVCVGCQVDLQAETGMGMWMGSFLATRHEGSLIPGMTASPASGARRNLAGAKPEFRCVFSPSV